MNFSIASLMIAMRSYIMLVSKGALSDLDGIAQYVSSLHRPESGHKYVNKILGRLASLSFTADIFQTSRFAIAKEIHPMAKTMSIINHRWTVIFHTTDDNVIIDRIIPSKMMVR